MHTLVADDTPEHQDKTLERTYSCPFIAHNTLEPMNFFANVQDNSVELVGPILLKIVKKIKM